MLPVQMLSGRGNTSRGIASSFPHKAVYSVEWEVNAGCHVQTHQLLQRLVMAMDWVGQLQPIL